MKQSAPKPKPKAAQAHDRHFIWRFAAVIAGLNVLLGAFALVAWGTQRAYQRDQGARIELAALEARIQPIGRVITDASKLPPPVAANGSASGAPKSGEQVVGEVCSACHGAGVMGAPKIGDASAWKTRLKAAGGANGLARSASKGKGSMPPKGGRPDLSDAELKAAIETMLKRSGAGA